MASTADGSLSAGIKAAAAGLGFHLCGIARARRLDDCEPLLRSWIDAGMNDNMAYLGRDIGRRLDPSSLLPAARSVIVTGLGYYSETGQRDPEAPILSRYTYGKDYHEVINEKLGRLLDWIQEKRPGISGRFTVDSSPVLEKAWAREAGLGWQGKHSVVISKKIGSFFFIGILIVDAELEYDQPFEADLCGDCRICIESCPTGAINCNRTIDARKCIANLTIENRGPIPAQFVPKLGKRIYGCDRCQEVCPWNRKAGPSGSPEFTIDEEIAGMSIDEWKDLSPDRFSRLFKNTSMSRVRYGKLMDNIDAAMRSEV